MGLKPGYKQTEVGVIPEDWDDKSLGEIGESLIGLTYKPTDVRSDGILVLRSSNVQEGTLRFENNVFVEMEIPEKIMVKPGDVLICVRNGSRDLIGKCAKIDERAVGMTFGAFMAVYRSPFHAFVYHEFQSGIIKRQIQEHLGATINQITNKSLNSFRIPLPTKTEQDVIAGALSDADALIESLEQLLAKKRQFKQGAMQELLTGKKRLPGFEKKTGYKKSDVGVIPVDWDLYAIDSLASITTGGRNTQDSVDDGLYPFFVRSQTIERINSYSFEGEAVVTAGDGVGTGKVFHYINGRFDAHQRVYRISNFAENLNGYFFYLYFSNHFHARIMQMTAKSSVDSVRREMIAKMPIPLPPNRDEQTAIAAVLTDMGAEIATLENKLTKARQLKTGMMQELLTGRIRLL